MQECQVDCPKNAHNGWVNMQEYRLQRPALSILGLGQHAGISKAENRTSPKNRVGQHAQESTDGENLWKINFEQRIVYLIIELQFQIWAAGLREYFFYESGRYAHEALGALNFLGASKAAKMFETVINYWPNAIGPEDASIRRKLLNTVLKTAVTEWERLYATYTSEITEEEDLFEKPYQFILTNSSKFY